MASRRRPVKDAKPFLGEKIGKKRADRRWRSPDGEEWDSRYEYIVYRKYREAGYAIERCTESDTFSFTLPIRGGECRSCGATTVGQRRTFTPDFRIVSPDKQHPAVAYYIETKGYLRARERSLARSFNKAHPNADVRYIFQSDHRISRPTTRTDGCVISWFKRFMPGKRAQVWTGEVKPFESEVSQDTAKRNKRVRRSKPRTQRGRIPRHSVH